MRPFTVLGRLRSRLHRGDRPVPRRGAWGLALTVLAAWGLAATSRAEAPAASQPADELPEALSSPLAESIEGKLNQGKAFIADGDYSSASRATLAAAAQAIQEYRRKPRPARAEERLNTAIDALLALADQALAAQEFGVARHCYNQLHGVRRPSEWEPLLGLAEVSRLSGQPWEAYQFYSDYLKLPSRPRDHRGELGLGLVSLQLGNLRTAQHYLERAVRLAPRNAEASMALARALHGVNKHKEAISHAETAVRIDLTAPPEERHVEYQYWLAIILKGSGEYDRAVAVARRLNESVLARFKEDPTDPERIQQLNQVLELRYGLLEDLAGTDLGGRDPQTFVDMARVIEDQGAVKQIEAYLQALTMLEKAKMLQPESVNVLLQQGRLYRLAGDRKRAVEAYQAVLKVSPGHEDAKTTLREMDAPLAPTEPTSAPTTTSAPAP